jgi:hypothetical protein
MVDPEAKSDFLFYAMDPGGTPICAALQLT